MAHGARALHKFDGDYSQFGHGFVHDARALALASLGDSAARHMAASSESQAAEELLLAMQDYSPIVRAHGH